MKYNVHFMGYYGYDVEVEADSEDEARDKATDIFEEADANEFFFESNGVDIWEVNEMSCFEPNMEMIEFWINEFKNNDVSLEEEIDDIKGTISNERIWQKGSDTQEQIDMHEQAIVDLGVYLEWLEDEEIEVKKIDE